MKGDTGQQGTAHNPYPSIEELVGNEWVTIDVEPEFLKQLLYDLPGRVQTLESCLTAASTLSNVTQKEVAMRMYMCYSPNIEARFPYIATEIGRLHEVPFPKLKFGPKITKRARRARNFELVLPVFLLHTHSEGPFPSDQDILASVLAYNSSPTFYDSIGIKLEVRNPEINIISINAAAYMDEDPWATQHFVWQYNGAPRFEHRFEKVGKAYWQAVRAAVSMHGRVPIAEWDKMGREAARLLEATRAFKAHYFAIGELGHNMRSQEGVPTSAFHMSEEAAELIAHKFTYVCKIRRAEAGEGRH